ncbi:MAG: hypothetical protein A2148_03745 [Chloroflexi bacterium RBG_16_68_14]|nr:MAG: hypothetical protein A2148_03745 [Chloroflexi bacterium RBG_16_68_14]
MTRLWRELLLLAIVTSSLAVLAVGTLHPLAGASAAPVAEVANDPPPRRIIPGRYIVQLRDGADPGIVAESLGKRYGFRADRTFRHAVSGFAAYLPTDAVEALRQNPNVAVVEPDHIVTVAAETLPTGIDRIDAEPPGDINDSGPDSDVDVAIIDTGSGPHTDLNVAGGFASYAEVFSIWLICGNSATIADGNGHGTHTAGTVAARNNASHVVGVAPGARIWSVKVLGPSGSGCMSDVIAGVDWVTANADTIEVANMSLGGGNSSALCNAIASSIAAGVTYVVSAGNSATNASNTSPANCAGVITVSALADFDGKPGSLDDQTVVFSSCTENQDDSLACFSNYGSVVDIAGPGVKILSTYLNDGVATASGTSMSAPHVTGAAASYIISNPGASPAAVRAALIAAGECPGGEPVGGDEVCNDPWPDDPDGINEPLVHVGSAPPPPTATPTGPTATPTDTSTPTPTSTPTSTRTPTATPSACTAPALSGTDSNPTGGGRVSLSWTAVPGAGTYRLQRRNVGSGSWSTVTTTSSISWSGSERRESDYRVRVQTGTCSPVPGPYSAPFNPQNPP